MTVVIDGDSKCHMEVANNSGWQWLTVKIDEISSDELHLIFVILK